MSYNNPYFSGMPLTARNKRKQLGNLICKGRGKPIGPQSLVVMTVDADHDNINPMRLGDSTKTYAPHVVSDDIDRNKRGEIAIMPVTANMVTRNTVTGFTSVNATSHVGGFPLSEKCVFGVFDNPSAGEGVTPNMDTASVVRIQGTATCINTGLDNIPILTPIMVDMNPSIKWDNERQKMVNVIDYSEESVPEDKFYPATYSMTASNVIVNLGWLTDSVDDFMDSNRFKEDSDNEVSVRTEVNNILSRAKVHVGTPLHSWLHLYTARKLIHRALYKVAKASTANGGNTGPGLVAIASRFVTELAGKYAVVQIQEYEKNDLKEKQQFDQQMGNSRSSGYQKLNMSEYLTAKATAAGLISSFPGIFVVLTPRIDRALIACQARHQDFLDSQYLGLSLSNSPPGAALHLNIRAGRG